MSNNPKHTQVDWDKAFSTNSRSVITESDKCENCCHSEICNVKNNLTALNVAINDLARLMENRNFTITVTCKHYIKNTGNIR